MLEIAKFVLLIPQPHWALCNSYLFATPDWSTKHFFVVFFSVLRCTGFVLLVGLQQGLGDGTVTICHPPNIIVS